MLLFFVATIGTIILFGLAYLGLQQLRSSDYWRYRRRRRQRRARIALRRSGTTEQDEGDPSGEG